MQRNNILRAHAKDAKMAELNPWRVIVAFLLYVYILAWLIVSLLTKDLWVNNLLRPYLPDWALLAVAFTAPITLAIVGLDRIQWRIRVLFIFILSMQAAMFGLAGERFRYVQGGITLLAFLEAYVNLPKLNRRSSELGNDGTILNLK